LGEGLGGLWALERAWHIRVKSCAAFKATEPTPILCLW